MSKVLTHCLLIDPEAISKTSCGKNSRSEGPLIDAASIMSDRKAISSIKKQISSREAELRVKPFINDYIPESQKVLFYPYYWMLVECTTKTLVGKRRSIRAS